MEEGQEAANRIAVLVLTRNHEAWIGACLDSIVGSGLQDYRVWVLDDGSTDGTVDVVRRKAGSNDRITLLEQVHSGNTAANSQKLVDSSTGEIVVLMSGDDLLGPAGDAARCVRSLEADTGLALVLPRMVYLMQQPEQRAPECHSGALLAALRSGDPQRVLDEHLHRTVSRIFLQGMTLRRSVIEAAGGFDTDLLADDYAFNMRLFRQMAEAGNRFRFAEDCLWLYRVHGGNMHRDPIRQFTLIAQVVARYVPPARRRDFHWDVVLLEDLAQLTQIRRVAEELLGPDDAPFAVLPSFRHMLRTAVKRRNLRLLRQMFLGKGLAEWPRLTVAYLAAVAHRRAF